jgi:hypothetical protein
MWLEATKQKFRIFTMVRSNLKKIQNFYHGSKQPKTKNSGFLPLLEAT